MDEVGKSANFSDGESDEDDNSNIERETPPAPSSVHSLSRSPSPSETRRERSHGSSKSRDSLSRSRSRSRSELAPGSRSGSSSRGSSRSRSRSIERSMSRSRSRSRSKSGSRSRSSSASSGAPIAKRSKLNLDFASEDEKSENERTSNPLGFALSDTEEEEEGGSTRTGGGGGEDQQPGTSQSKSEARGDDSSDDELIRDDDPARDGFDVSGNDFDNMMQRKKAENKRYRKSKNIDIINENDDAIAKMIADMRIAAKEDRDLNLNGRPASKKMGMFKMVLHNLRKADFQMAFVEGNLLSVMTDWLAPLPDKSLPHIVIRTEFLKLLEQMRIDDMSRLKESGIGKAVMYLYRHPREERNNKNRAGHLIYEWARPIFKKETDFAKMTKEERREQDLDMAARLGKRRKAHKEETEEQQIRPGDPGWVGRARVPMVDNVEFINRPKWQTEENVEEVKKKKVTLLEKHKRKFAERKRLTKTVTMSKISIEGNHMKEF